MRLGADREGWATFLRGLGEPVLASTPVMGGGGGVRAWIQSFRDELGNRRRVDAALLARVAGLDPGGPPAGCDAEERLWYLGDPEGDEGLRTGAGEEGPLTPGAWGGNASIEARTEGDLMALHALWARRGARGWVRARCLSAAAWHVRELQPDNATGLPWAVHVFVEAAIAQDDPGERAAHLLHAQGLVHASCVLLGRPGVRAACILVDAARELEVDGSCAPIH